MPQVDKMLTFFVYLLIAHVSILIAHVSSITYLYDNRVFIPKEIIKVAIKIIILHFEKTNIKVFL